MTRSKLFAWAFPPLHGLVAILLAYVAAFVVVTAYATYLSFLARGAPDQTRIARFADNTSPWVVAVGGVFFTALLARRAVKRNDSASPITGIWVGVFSGLYAIVASYVFKPQITIRSVFSSAGMAILLLFSGWLGGLLGTSGAPSRPAD